MPSESPTSAPTNFPSVSPTTSIPTESPTDSPTQSPTRATKLLIIEMECPADLVTFEAELKTELHKKYPDVEISGVECGSVKITLMHMGDDMDELDECADHIASEGLSLPSYGMVGGKKIEKDTDDSNSFPAWGIVLICLAILAGIAGGVYCYHDHVEKKRKEEKWERENKIQVSHEEPKTPTGEATKKSTQAEIPRVSLSETAKEILKEDLKKAWKPRTQPIETPSRTNFETKNHATSTTV